MSGVLRQFSEVMHDKMSKIKTTVRFCLTIFNFLNYKFIIHSNSIPILKLYTDTFKKMVCLRWENLKNRHQKKQEISKHYCQICLLCYSFVWHTSIVYPKVDEYDNYKWIVYIDRVQVRIWSHRHTQNRSRKNIIRNFIFSNEFIQSKIRILNNNK